jgi:hypothetical protein
MQANGGGKHFYEFGMGWKALASWRRGGSLPKTKICVFLEFAIIKRSIFLFRSQTLRKRKSLLPPTPLLGPVERKNTPSAAHVGFFLPPTKSIVVFGGLLNSRFFGGDFFKCFGDPRKVKPFIFFLLYLVIRMPQPDNN